AIVISGIVPVGLIIGLIVLVAPAAATALLRLLLPGLLLCLLLELLGRGGDVHTDYASSDLCGRRRSQHEVDAAQFRGGCNSNRNGGLGIDTAGIKRCRVSFFRAILSGRYRRNWLPAASTAAAALLERLLCALHEAAAPRV